MLLPYPFWKLNIVWLNELPQHWTIVRWTVAGCFAHFEHLHFVLSWNNHWGHFYFCCSTHLSNAYSASWPWSSVRTVLGHLLRFLSLVACVTQPNWSIVGSVYLVVWKFYLVDWTCSRASCGTCTVSFWCWFKFCRGLLPGCLSVCACCGKHRSNLNRLTPRSAPELPLNPEGNRCRLIKSWWYLAPMEYLQTAVLWFVFFHLKTDQFSGYFFHNLYLRINWITLNSGIPLANVIVCCWAF